MTRTDEVRLLELIRAARPHIFSIGQQTEHWLSRLEEQHDALRELVETLLTTKPPTAVEVAASRWRFWWLRGHMGEGRAFLERARRIEGAVNAEVLKGLGTIAFRLGDLVAAEEAFRERLELAQRTGQKRDLADAFADMARIALRRGEFAAVRSFAERGYAAAKDLGPEAVRAPLHMRAAAARMEGRFVEARTLYLESRALNERLGNEGNVAARTTTSSTLRFTAETVMRPSVASGHRASGSSPTTTHISARTHSSMLASSPSTMATSSARAVSSLLHIGSSKKPTPFRTPTIESNWTAQSLDLRPSSASDSQWFGRRVASWLCRRLSSSRVDKPGHHRLLGSLIR